MSVPSLSAGFLPRTLVEVPGGRNIRIISFSPSGVLLACGDDKGYVSMYDAPSGTLVTSYTIATGSLSASSVSVPPGISALAWMRSNGIDGEISASTTNESEISNLVIGTLEGTIHQMKARQTFWSRTALSLTSFDSQAKILVQPLYGLTWTESSL